nr:syntaxin-binding protein 5-like [Paramormyrops kingsleyae]
MKKFNIRKVLDGLTAVSSSSAASQPGNKENDLIPETLQSEHFQLCKTVRHGFPYQPSSMAFDPVQKILAIGTQSGALRLYPLTLCCPVKCPNRQVPGRQGSWLCEAPPGPGLAGGAGLPLASALLLLEGPPLGLCSTPLPPPQEVRACFFTATGALVSALADDSIHLWNLRQKRPAILHSLKFNRERITFCHLPFQSKWLYVGTERGNIHIVNVESFTLSGYVIMWNKAIELTQPRRLPEFVVPVSMTFSPTNFGRPCVTGHVRPSVLFPRERSFVFSIDVCVCPCQAIHSLAWHHEGKQFICSHSDGTLTIWNVKSPGKPVQTITPHGKQPKDGKKPEPCKPILKVEYKTTRAGDPYMILSGGLSYDTVGRRPCLTVMHGKSTAVLEMDHPIVDFLTLCETPYPNDFQEPYAVVVLLEKDLVVIDLAQNGYPIFENPYPLAIHESPVTCCEYFADCPVDIIPALYSVGARQKRQGYSKKEWPISGGNWGLGTQSYPEIIITGYRDGLTTTPPTPRSSTVMLQVLYKLKTAKVFEKSRNKEDKPSTDIVDEDPFAIQILSWCAESRMLCVAGVSAHVIVYRFSKQEVTTEVVQLLEVRLQYELNDAESPDVGGEQLPAGGTSSPQTSVSHSHPSTSSSSSDGIRDNVPCLKVRSTPLKQSPGYQVELVVQLVWVSGEPPQQITSLAVNSSYGLVVFGNSNGLAVVDYLQKTVLLNLGTVELYGSNDPYQRQPRSPRKSRQPSGGLGDISEGSTTSEDRCKSPTSVLTSNHQQLYNGGCRGAKMSRKLSLPTELKPDLDGRDSSFSRSRSSSVTSIDKEAREAITSLHFAETFARKGEAVATPSLWVGTSLGTVLAVALSLPPPGEQRLLQPVIVSPSGTLIRLKGSILRMAFLDSTGAIIPPSHEPWYEPNAFDDRDEREKARKRRPVSVSPSASQELSETHYAVVCSEKQAKVLALPSQASVKHSITETSFVLRSDVVQMGSGVCVACFCANGHIMALSLPSLRPLLDVNYLPLTDMRIARTFCFSNNGQAMYLISPTEIQRITYSQDTCENLQEMLGELFTPVETPEAPNRGFFKGLFGGGAQSLDREELFGESVAGKASRSLAQHIPGPGGIEGMKGAASGVVGDLARARIALDERGQKLGELEERTAAMMASAESFSKHAHDMMLKCKDKKWYQF